ncbi:MAG: hypothetical protein EAY76_00820 [Alphaproteobacteria bacterium]|nr:MAG: hypothetical protein EAY76_00820 [Alphaproteobacteria bacterium]TAF76927.1 MAG: hypothetical protein EAZ52_02060 [Alphaproteobacteria bacterium]
MTQAQQETLETPPALPASIKQKINRDATFNGVMETVIDPFGGMFTSVVAIGSAFQLAKNALGGTLTKQNIIGSSAGMLIGGGITAGLIYLNKDAALEKEQGVYQAELPKMNEHASGWNDLNGLYKMISVVSGVCVGGWTGMNYGGKAASLAENFKQGTGNLAMAGTAVLGGCAAFGLIQAFLLHNTNAKRQELRDAVAQESMTPSSDISDAQQKGMITMEREPQRDLR